MARGKPTLVSQQINDELAKLDQTRRELLERRKQAVATEDGRRGEIIRRLLQGDAGRDLGALILRLVQGGERDLFAVGKEPQAGDDGADGDEGASPPARSTTTRGNAPALAGVG